MPLEAVKGRESDAKQDFVTFIYTHNGLKNTNISSSKKYKNSSDFLCIHNSVKQLCTVP
jgi:hypothetical protein